MNDHFLQLVKRVKVRQPPDWTDPSPLFRGYTALVAAAKSLGLPGVNTPWVMALQYLVYKWVHFIQTLQRTHKQWFKHKRVSTKLSTKLQGSVQVFVQQVTSILDLYRTAYGKTMKRQSHLVALALLMVRKAIDALDTRIPALYGLVRRELLQVLTRASTDPVNNIDGIAKLIIDAGEASSKHRESFEDFEFGIDKPSTPIQHYRNLEEDLGLLPTIHDYILEPLNVKLDITEMETPDASYYRNLEEDLGLSQSYPIQTYEHVNSIPVNLLQTTQQS